MKRKALYLDDSEKELDALLENEDFWKPGKSEWDSEILDITNKQRELEESQYVKSRSNEAYCYLLSELYPMAEKRKNVERRCFIIYIRMRGFLLL